MKLSKSKLALAKVINENGGWMGVADCATQDKDEWVCFYEGKPTRRGESWRDNGDCIYKYGFDSGEKIKNWHQCVLSREEYYQAYPKAGADGWIEWSGVAKSPVSKGVAVDVKMKNGTQHFGQLIDDECWGDHWGDASIIAYRLHKQGAKYDTGDGEQNPVVKPEFCESVTRSIPEPDADDAESRLAKALELVKEAAPHLLTDKYKFNGDEIMGVRKPTIEQLAHDYRNAKDYADRLQQEADAAQADAEAKLAAYVAAAGSAVGLVLGVEESAPEPELVITDWRDLREGDIIEYVDGDVEDKIGMSGPVVEFAEDASDGLFVQLKCDNGPNKGRLGWPTKWRFIRRP